MRIRPQPQLPKVVPQPAGEVAASPQEQAAAPRSRSLGRDFSLVEGGQQHLFALQGAAQAHLLVRPDSRVIASFPAENSGVSLWFGEGARVSAVGPVRAEQGPQGQAIEVALRSEGPVLDVREAVLGSIRAIRERAHETPELEAVRRDREAFARLFGAPAGWAREQVSTREVAGRREVVFEREDLRGGAYRARLTVGPEVRVEPSGQGGLRLTAPGPFEVRMRAEVPHPPMAGYSPQELFSPAALQLLDGLPEGDPRAERATSAMQSLAFLARGGKLMAGSWRFLTYFGRDTLLSLMLLRPAITDRVYQDGLQSVIDRLSPTGQVAHEEDLGAWAERRRVADALRAASTAAVGAALPHAAAPLAGALAEELSRPIYDYKMVDDDFLFPLALERIFEDPAAAGAFLERRGPEGRPNLEGILANWDHVLRTAEPFARASAAGEPRESLFRHTVKIRDDEHVGDWRDSNEGLGWGRYPGSVNVDLVPAALRAVARMASQVPPARLAEAARSAGLEDLPDRLAEARFLAEEWDSARDAYRVRLSPEEVRQRLVRYFEEAPLTEGEKELYRSRPVGDVTLGDFLDGQAVPEPLRDGLSFMALSLDAEGRPVEVANSDASFRLFLGDPPRADVSEMLKLLELEYPVGLMTGVGPVVANPAYSGEGIHHRQLGRGAYHGAVVWSWQSAMLQAGLLRQLERYGDDPDLGPRIRAAVDRLAAAEDRAGALANSELWTHRVEGGGWEAVAFGAGSAADATESNAAQLWSTVYPAVLLRREAAG